MGIKLYEMTEREMLIKIATQQEEMDKKIDEIKNNCQSQKKICDGHVGGKVSKFTFIVVVTIFTGIISWVAVDAKELKVEVKKLIRGVNQCDFSEYEEE